MGKLSTERAKEDLKKTCGQFEEKAKRKSSKDYFLAHRAVSDSLVI